jgi:hypothetical protein
MPKRKRRSKQFRPCLAVFVTSVYALTSTLYSVTHPTEGITGAVATEITAGHFSVPTVGLLGFILLLICSVVGFGTYVIIEINDNVHTKLRFGRKR